MIVKLVVAMPLMLGKNLIALHSTQQKIQVTTLNPFPQLIYIFLSSLSLRYNEFLSCRVLECYFCGNSAFQVNCNIHYFPNNLFAYMPFKSIAIQHLYNFCVYLPLNGIKKDESTPYFFLRVHPSKQPPTSLKTTQTQVPPLIVPCQTKIEILIP